MAKNVPLAIDGALGGAAEGQVEGAYSVLNKIDFENNTLSCISMRAICHTAVASASLLIRRKHVSQRIEPLIARSKSSTLYCMQWSRRRLMEAIELLPALLAFMVVVLSALGVALRRIDVALRHGDRSTTTLLQRDDQAIVNRQAQGKG